MRPADTTPEARAVFMDIQRRMTPSEKFQKAMEWSDLGRQLMQAGLRQQYPTAGDHEIFLRYMRRTLGRELFLKVYGDVLPNDEAGDGPPKRASEGEAL